MKTVINRVEKKYRDSIVEPYHYLHQYPELSYDEKNTSQFIINILKKLHFDEIQTNVGGYGVVGLLNGAKPGPVIALRADMDALAIKEDTGSPVSSLNDGIMHACGHDAHMAILLGAAKVLCEIKGEMAGTIKFVFQPAEEKPPLGGASLMIADGILENPKVNAMLGLHVWPYLKVGTIGIEEGPASSSSDHLSFTINGKSSHGAIPDEGIDTIVASAAVISAMQSIVSRRISPFSPVVITLGKICGGDGYNIISDHVYVEGTVRSFNENVRDKLPELIKQTIKNTVAAFGANADVHYDRGCPSVMNDPYITEICKNAAREILGHENLCSLPTIPAIGEDFAFFAREVPSVFAYVGCCPCHVLVNDMPPLHNSKFLPDEDTLSVGVRYITCAALKLLEKLG
ncbi:M20 metallopeptidase family protein [Cloacibacillus evryensis]|uniref:M20 family metallopeptidase n=1 Tax=Cloacibacillus evryensis TaxID=508460 RepID=A0AAW5K1X2_9BACT|nr:M20 family metallopeptidase [Cloacibacillus evryensis]MCQ4762788.1 M20 family metallopeptidase [Cloacibacillus evryensis]MCQ4813124.1 M20 family metallopeptidase [Cloacibacillus evryensis]